jgi:hypothetical protein
MTSRDQIKDWLELGVSQGYTHALIVCDTFSYEDFPVYISKDESAKERQQEEASKPMQIVMEVYNLSLDLMMQLSAGKAFFY